jgi:hypothetical protein
MGGLGAGVDALVTGARAIVAGRHLSVLCGAFDWPSLHGARLLATATSPTTPTDRAVAFLVVEDIASAARRRARVLARASLVGSGPALQHGRATVSPAVAPLLWALDELVAGTPAVTVSGRLGGLEFTQGAG